MKQLTKLQSFFFLLGGLLMVLGAGGYVLLWHQDVCCWLFLAGSVLFSVIQSMQSYEGSNMVIRRLKGMMTLADLLFVLTGILMVDSSHHFLLPLFNGEDGYYTYIKYVYNKWVLLLLIGGFLEVYSTHRISRELEKES